MLAKGLGFMVGGAVVPCFTNFDVPAGLGLIFEIRRAGVASPGATLLSSSFFRVPRAVIGLAVGAFLSSEAAGAVLGS